LSAAAGRVARALGIALASTALAGAASPSPAPSALVVLHAGDAITDRQMFAYLSYPPSPGDWVRYRVDFPDGSSVEKTIGFGVEQVAGAPTLFVETHVSATAVSGLPAESTIGIGTDAVLKEYVAGSVFDDLAHAYAVETSAVKVGQLEYEVAPGSGATYSVLTGAVDAPARMGKLRSVTAVDIRVGAAIVHATHLIADFPVSGPPSTVEIWQSPDAPIGTIAIKAGGVLFVGWRMIAFGRGDYATLFAKSLDAIRKSSQPAMP